MKLTARTQAGLSYLIIGGYFGILIGEGMKYLTPGTASGLKDIIMLVAAYWFMRQRNPAEEKPTPPAG
jgi:hypothetical protein